MKSNPTFFLERRASARARGGVHAVRRLKTTKTAAGGRYLATVCFALLTLVPAAAHASAGLGTTHAAAGHAIFSTHVPRTDGTVGRAAAMAKRQGYLAAHPAAYHRAKAAADAKAAAIAEGGARFAGELAPVQARGFDGLTNPNAAPSDSTGSVGSRRFIELVNSQLRAVQQDIECPDHNRDAQHLGGRRRQRLRSADDVGCADEPLLLRDGPGGQLDHKPGRDRASAQTASPNNGSTDFCHYTVNFGSDLPDYPKLGDSSASGSSARTSSTRAGRSSASDAVRHLEAARRHDLPGGELAQVRRAVRPPRPDRQPGVHAGARRPDRQRRRRLHHRSHRLGAEHPALAASRDEERDHRHCRYSRRPAPRSSCPATRYRRALRSEAGSRTRPSGSTRWMRGRHRPSSAIDPAHGNAVGLWVQHTTATNPAGRSEVRWYEINPRHRQRCSNRARRPTPPSSRSTVRSRPTAREWAPPGMFGNSMVLGFDTSSTTSFPAVRMVSKVGAAAQSAPRPRPQLGRQLLRLRLRRHRQQLPLGRLRRRQPRPDRRQRRVHRHRSGRSASTPRA